MPLQSVPGSFAYRPAAGEVLAAGQHELSVTFAPADTLNYTTARVVAPMTITEKLSAIITWPTPSAVSYGTALSGVQLNATASVPGKFVYTPSAGLVLAPGKYTLSASFTPSETEKYAPAQATVVLEVEGSPDAAPETPSAQDFTADNSAPEDPARAEATDEFSYTMPSPRETRTYMGAIYERGEDGQWHLQKT